MVVAAVASMLGALAACTFLVDTEGLTGADPDGSNTPNDGGVTDSAPSDAQTLPIACGDASTSATCRMFGLCCPAAAPFCRVALDFHGRASTVACAATEDTRRSDDPCTPDAGHCADGLSCTLAYPSASTRYVCRPLCKTIDDCGDSGLFCNHRVSAEESVRQCGQCDGVSTGSDCPSDTPLCSPVTTVGPPRCIYSYTGTKGLGGPCADEHDCQLGLVCQCNADGGAVLVGGDCASAGGVCRVPCYPYDEGTACGAGTCKIIVGSDYALCLP